MDGDFWATRVHSAKNFSALQDARLNHSSNHLIIGDEGGDEMRAWFPCPFCYVEIEVPVLCVHLQEEHCFDLKDAVCPICAANLGKDAIGHFTMKHAHSIKRKKNTQKSGFWSNVSTNIVKDIRELSSYSMSSQSNRSEPAPDPLFSPFLCNVPLSDPKYSRKDTTSYIAATNDLESRKTSQKEEVHEQDYEERKQKAAFLLELIASTIFSDSMEENQFQ
ncbi:protein DEHYDRATION-INDUCED 19 homolog 5-like isoform X1 [Olea europaea var. sylvestris]|uniref:protein DEHYDRATION-INDUCED 19 homolog 5-like isoform X1 n=1 Tax=Olea europaea var. sylvestris TaxID=158386 RepID=UPI000C1CE804|nr:protein DEHYDRATION-INDUCED 19 homolog 5-like isoform X1 [Olea europaea var. sylvestris]XP_022885296.1 protein DEHYDRATION-INDUCED 19 homolog 5-like isoform X1 [Olea europaea var. sylvestris]